jgi:lipoprotein-anchoring transpeptidase ErfK/SrfK
MRLGLMAFQIRVLIALFTMSIMVGSASAEVVIYVDKSTQRMIVTKDSAQLFSWVVSTGGRGYATPSGSFHPFRLDADHHSDEWDNAPMPHSIFFTREGHAIHGSFEKRHLGRAVSHGCVRLSPSDAATLFALVRREGMANTRVVIGSGAPVEAKLTPLLKKISTDGTCSRERHQSLDQTRSLNISPYSVCGYRT